MQSMKSYYKNWNLFKFMNNAENHEIILQSIQINENHNDLFKSIKIYRNLCKLWKSKIHIDNHMNPWRSINNQIKKTVEFNNIKITINTNNELSLNSIRMYEYFKNQCKSMIINEFVWKTYNKYMKMN